MADIDGRPYVPAGTVPHQTSFPEVEKEAGPFWEKDDTEKEKKASAKKKGKRRLQGKKLAALSAAVQMPAVFVVHGVADLMPQHRA